MSRRVPALFLLFAALVTTITVACHSAAPVASPDPLRLEAGRYLDDSLAPGEEASYLLDLAVESFVQIYVQQSEGEANVRIVDAAGMLLGEADAPHGTRKGRIFVAVVGEGAYRVVVTPAGGRTARYQLRLVAARPAEPGDRERAAGLRAYVHALALLDPDVPRRRQTETVALLEEAQNRFRPVDPFLYGYALLRQADAWLELDRPEEAHPVIRRSLEVFQDLSTEEAQRGRALEGEAAAWSVLAKTLKFLDRTDEALAAFDRAIDLYGDVSGGRYGQALNLNNRADLHRDVERPDLARRDLERALALLPEDRPRDRITFTINLASAHQQQGDLERSYALYQQAEKDLEALDGPSEAADLHLHATLARFYLVVGRLDEARTAIERGLELSRRMGDLRIEQALYESLGQLEQALGNLDASHGAASRALALALQVGEAPLLARNLLKLGQVEILRGRNGEARQAVEEALEVARDAGRPALEALARSHLGSLLAAEGRVEEARQMARPARSLAAGAPAPLRSEVLIRLASLALDLEDAGEAEARIREALETGSTADDPLAHATLLSQRARAARMKNDLEAAQQDLEEALTIYEDIRGRLASPGSRTTFLSTWHHRYVELVDLLVERHQEHPDAGYAGRALAVSERSRARTLVEMLTESRIRIRRHVEPALLEREEQLRDLLSLLQSEILRAMAEADSAAADSLRVELAATRREYRDVETEIRQRFSRYSALRYPAPAERPAIQSRIPDDTLLLQFLLGPRRSFLFAVGSSSLSIHPLPAAEVLRGQVDDLREALHGRDPRSRSRFRVLSRRLYGSLLEPAGSALEGVEQLWIVADDRLHYLPFEALLRPDGRFVVERWTVGYAPSATVLESLSEPRQASPSPLFVAFAGPSGSLVVGDGSAEAASRRRDAPGFAPLPGTVAEVRSIAKLFPDRSHLYLGPEANQDNLEDNPLVSGATWLHFASHGLLQEEEPAESAILLSPDRRGDALLQVFEIFNLDLGSDLVTLSACETGLGKEVRGEGLLGLTQAFFYAGSRNVLVTLWPVGDRATEQLMIGFYVHLAAGASPAESLRKAKRELAEEGMAAGDWSSFVLIGAPKDPPAGNEAFLLGAQAPVF